MNQCVMMGVWILCVLCVWSEMTWSFPTPPSETRKQEFLRPDSHHSQIIETIEAGKNNTLQLIQEVAHSDLHTEPNPASDLISKEIGYTKSNKKFQTVSKKESENQRIHVFFEYSAVKSGKPESLSLSRREALQQTDVGVGDASWSTMVLTIASTLVALFSMSVLVAVFQCCCPRRKRNSSPEVDNKEEKQPTDDQNKNNEKSSKEETARQNNVERKQGEDSQEKTEEKLSFKDKLKAFEKKDDSKEPPLRPGPTPKKRPQSEAFKAFEGKGLPIMGMPKGQAPRFPKPKETPQEDKEEPEVTMRPKITVTPSPDTVSDSGSYKQPDNPDVIIAEEEDDDSEFGAIKRETAVLRSYRKAPPPKNRNRSSAAFRRKNAQQSVANLFDNLDIISEDKESEPLLTAVDNGHIQIEVGGSSKDRSEMSPESNQTKKTVLKPKERSRSKTPEKLDSKNSSEKSAPKTVPEKADSKTPDNNGSRTPNSTGSKTPDRAGSKTPDKAGSKTPDKAGSKTPNKERSKTPDRSGSKTPEEKKASTVNSDSQPQASSPMGGNIFAQIDPTVKKSSPAVPPPANLETKSRADKVKSSPGFLEDDKLMKALNEKLKAQQEGKDDKDKRQKRQSLSTDL